MVANLTYFHENTHFHNAVLFYVQFKNLLFLVLFKPLRFLVQRSQSLTVTTKSSQTLPQLGSNLRIRQ